MIADVESGRLSTSTKSAWQHFYALVGILVLVSGGQLLGLEVVGGDPDKFFRPLKSEFVRNIWAGRLPLWSDLFGFGMPLAGQSEIGAFYLPHWLIYPIFGADFGYRLSMFLHQLMAATFLFILAKKLGASPKGAMLGGLIYVSGGFPTIQASKEWAVLGMAWIPSAFLGVEIWLADKNRKGLGLLAFSLASLAWIGHFQLAQITSLGLFIWVITRTIFQRDLLSHWPGLIASVILGIAMASPQLALSWKYASDVEATSRSVATLSYYSYPLWNLSELAFPVWTRMLQGGPEGAYWTIHQTTQFESCQFIGTSGFIFAILALSRLRSRPLKLPILMLIIAGLILATMPQWSPELYTGLLKIPGFGLFRCPSRYGLLFHLGMALMAAIGFDDRFSKLSTILISLTLGLCLWSIFTMTTSGFAYPGGKIIPRFNPIQVYGIGFATWILFLSFIYWQQKKYSKLSSLVIILSALELSTFYYIGPTRWGMSLDLPDSSPVLTSLKSLKEPVMLAGPLENIPVTAGLTTAGAYFGVTMPPANESLKAIVELANQSDRQNRPNPADNPLARLGATHQLQFRPDANSQIFENDSLIHIILGNSKSSRPLVLRKLETGKKNTLPEAWLAQGGLYQELNQKSAFDRLLLDDYRSRIPILESHISDDILKQFTHPDTTATFDSDKEMLDFKVNHSGPVILVIKRTFDSGWIATDPSGNALQIAPVYGGLQGVLIEGDPKFTKVTTVKLQYWPQSLRWTFPLAAFGIVISLWLGVKNQS